MSDARTLAQLRKNCLLLVGPDGSSGSGYIVARGFGATAAHVVQGWADGEEFDLVVGWGKDQRREARGVLYARNVLKDAAVIQLKGCDDLLPCPISKGIDPGAAWNGFGFPAVTVWNGKTEAVHVQGRVRDPHWENRDDIPQMLLDSDESMSRTNLKGISGTAVVVDGALVGHLVEQFVNPLNWDESVLGQLKACHIRHVLELLPAGAEFGQEDKPVVHPDVSVADLLSWCDREAVTSTLNRWIADKPLASVGLLCLVGHSDNRQCLLLDRVACQLSDQKSRPLKARAAHINDKVDPESASDFAWAARESLGLRSEQAIQDSPKFADAAGLVLLNLRCYYPGRSAHGIESWIVNAAKWLQTLAIGHRRLVLVLAIRYESLPLFCNIKRQIEAACRRAGQLHPPVTSLLLGEPLQLHDYEMSDVRTWSELPLVQSQLRRTAHKIDGDVLKQWFRWKKRVSHGQLLRLIEGFHEVHSGARGART
jgi:hypothetical protein